MNGLTLRRASALFVMFALAGCGGSSGGPEDQQQVPPDAIQGEYGIYTLFGRSGPEEVETGTGTGTADGQGSLSLTTTVNTQGNVTSVGPQTTGYNLTSDGAVLFDAADALRGGTNPTGQGFVTAATADGVAPGLRLGLRKGGSGFSTASLSGTYHLVSFNQFLVDNSSIAIFSTAVFDGLGNTTATPLLLNQDATFPGSVPSDSTYTVDATGGFTDSFGSRGHVLEGDEVLAYAGPTTDGGDPYLSVLIREQTSASAALFSGSYWAVRFGQSGFSAFQSQTGSVTVDGVGAGTVDGTRNVEGTISEIGPSAVSFSVQASGRMDATFAGTSLFGAISADGRLAVFAGGATSGQPAQIWILVRKQ